MITRSVLHILNSKYKSFVSVLELLRGICLSGVFFATTNLSCLCEDPRNWISNILALSSYGSPEVSPKIVFYITELRFLFFEIAIRYTTLLLLSFLLWIWQT